MIPPQNDDALQQDSDGRSSRGKMRRMGIIVAVVAVILVVLMISAYLAGALKNTAANNDHFMAPVPSAAFTSNVTNGEMPLIVQFTDQSVNSPTSWSWDFGDGNISIEQNPTCIYNTPGIYSVSMTATNAWGSSTAIRTNYIIVNESDTSFFNFISDGSSITITGYTGPGGNVIIPSKIIGLPVTSIGDRAFSYCYGLTSIVIPNTVTSIGAYAFGSCTALTSIVIPNNVTIIGQSAFSVCISLTSVTIGSSVIDIGPYTFYHCTALTSMIFNGNAPPVGYNWASGFSNPLTVYYYPGATGFTTPEWDGSLCYPLTGTASDFDYTSDGSKVTITGYTGPGGNVIIPSKIIGLPVTSIGDKAFSNSYGLTSVTISDTVTSIGTFAFACCFALNSVTLGSGVTNISAFAFYYCDSLSAVTIGSNVTSIGEAAFSSCTALTAIGVDVNNSAYSSVDGVLYDKAVTTLVECPAGKDSVIIPNSVISIGQRSFRSCTALTSITIPDGVTSIGNGAFECCTSLRSVTIGNGVTTIGSDAFFGAVLTSIAIPDNVTSIGAEAFYGCHYLTSAIIGNGVTSIGFAAFSDCLALKSVTIGSSVTNIGAYAFERCMALTSITIPDGVTSIGDGAFRDCISMTSVTIGSGVTSIGNCTFQNCPALASMVFSGNAPTTVGYRWNLDCFSLVVYYYPGATGFTTPIWNGIPCHMMSC